MKTTSIILLLICNISLAQKAKQVLVISIDGLRPEFYLDREWDTPNLKSLVTNGVYSEGIHSVFPSVTYPSHTTLISGAFPREHGIFYNAPRDSKDNHWFWEYSRIQTKTIWDAAKEKGIRTGAVMWPVTVGAPITYNFPVRRPHGEEKGNQLSVTEPLVTPNTLMGELRSAGIIESQDQFTHEEIDKTIGAMGQYIIKMFQPSLMMIHFVNVDHMQHEHGRDNSFVKDAIHNVDVQIGKLIETLKEENIYDRTNIIVTGDHGHVDVNKTFLPNKVLKDAGLISDASWKAKFTTVGGGAFLYVKDKKYIEEVVNIFNALTDEQRQLFTIYDRSSLDNIGADPEAALGLGMRKGYVSSSSSKGTIVQDKKPVAAHGFFPDFEEIETGFIISGPDVFTHNKKITFDMGIQDITPLISHLLELDFESKDGVFYKGILED